MQFRYAVESNLIASVPFRGFSAACVLDQNFSHQVGANSKKMRAVLRVDRLLLDQAEIGFVYESRGLQCMVRTLPAELVVS